jgi:hypothetical protein
MLNRTLAWKKPVTSEFIFLELISGRSWRKLTDQPLEISNLIT